MVSFPKLPPSQGERSEGKNNVRRREGALPKYDGVLNGK